MPACSLRLAHTLRKTSARIGRPDFQSPGPGPRVRAVSLALEQVSSSLPPSLNSNTFQNDDDNGRLSAQLCRSCDQVLQGKRRCRSSPQLDRVHRARARVWSSQVSLRFGWWIVLDEGTA